MKGARKQLIAIMTAVALLACTIPTTVYADVKDTEEKLNKAKEEKENKNNKEVREKKQKADTITAAMNARQKPQRKLLNI